MESTRMKAIAMILGLVAVTLSLSACNGAWKHPHGPGHHDLHPLHHHDYKGERG